MEPFASVAAEDVECIGRITPSPVVSPVDQNADAGTAVERVEFEEIDDTDGPCVAPRLGDQPQLSRAEEISLLLCGNESLHLGAGEGFGRAADTPHRGVVLPVVEHLGVCRLHGPKPYDPSLEIHQMPITLLRMSIATPQALALSVIFEMRNLVSL